MKKFLLVFLLFLLITQSVNAESKYSGLNILRLNALDIDEVFSKEVSRIYLNFSDPWPKKRHEKRRLTSSVFLNKYKTIFKGLKVIEQKTDNDDLFNYSLESYKTNHFFIIKKNRNYFDDIRTEYENKFISKGKNINYVKVVKL